MTHVSYKVVQHDGGWAYKVGEVFSETFATHQEAHEAAVRAAERQEVGGDSTEIEYEDAGGKWHDEYADGGDRPETSVEDEPEAPKGRRSLSRDVGADEPLPNGPRK